MEKLARLARKLNPKITRQAMARGLNNFLLDKTLAPAEGMGTFLTSYPLQSNAYLTSNTCG